MTGPTEPAVSAVTEGVWARVRAAADAALGPESLRGLERLSGGHSGITLAATLADRDGSTRRVVLKCTPAGRSAVGRHDVLRQARIMRALAGVDGLGVPGVVFADAEAGLFAMELVAGEAVEPLLDPTETAACELCERFAGAARMLAALHAAAPASLDLGDVPVHTPHQELERWMPTLRAARLDLADADALSSRLAATVPADTRPVVVHGDFRLGNIVCDGPRPAAIIDWEIWSVGDPRVDLSWLLLFTEAESFPGFSAPRGVAPDRERLLATYEEAAGGPVADLEWFDALTSFKLAAVLAHNLRRHREGRHHDVDQERMAPAIPVLLRRGLERLA